MPGTGAKDSFLVIDVGTSSLKLLEIEKKKDDPVLRNFLIKEFPPDVQENPSLEKEPLAQLLKDTLANSNIKANKVILVLPDYVTDLVQLILPKETDEELRTTLKWELKDHISAAEEEIAFDYCTLEEMTEEGVQKTNLLVAAAQKKEIEKYIQVLNELRLEPVSFSIGFVSFLPIVKNTGLVEKDEEFAILDIGARTAKLGIYKGDVLRLFRKSSLGSRDISLTLMNESTNFTSAEEIKKNIGISATGMEEELDPATIETAQKNFASARPVLERLVGEVSQNIGFYKESLRGGELKKLFIFGGGARLKGLRTFLGSVTGLSIYTPNPFQGIETLDIDKSQLEAHSLTLARAFGVGLTDLKGLNLLPEEIKYKEKIRLRHLLVRSAVSLAVGILALIYLGSAVKGSISGKKLAMKEKEYAGLSPLMERIEKLDEKKALLQKRMDLCIEILSTEPFWEDILKEVSGLIPDNIILSRLNIQRKMAKKEETFSESTSRPSEEGIILTLEGTVRQGEISMEKSLTGFLNLLSESPFLSETKLNISKENKSGDKVVLDFIIQAEVQPTEINPIEVKGT